MGFVLTDVKKILGLAEEYQIFDLDILTHINSAFSTLNQLGIGPEEGMLIEDYETSWNDLKPYIPFNQLNLVKTYIYLKVKIAFDPPGTSFLLESLNNQIKEHEWRLNAFREEEKYPLATLLDLEIPPSSGPVYVPNAWDISNEYLPGNIVLYDGANWIALDTVVPGSQPGDGNWELYLLEYLPQEWAYSVFYPTDSVVAYNGVYYTALQNSQNAEPASSPEYWQEVS